MTVCQGEWGHIEATDMDDGSVVVLCSRYGTFGKDVPTLCGFCPFYKPNQGANIK